MRTDQKASPTQLQLLKGHVYNLVGGLDIMQIPKSVLCENMEQAKEIAEILGRPVLCEVNKRFLKVQPNGSAVDLTDKLARVEAHLKKVAGGQLELPRSK